MLSALSEPLTSLRKSWGRCMEVFSHGCGFGPLAESCSERRVAHNAQPVPYLQVARPSLLSLWTQSVHIEACSSSGIICSMRNIVIASQNVWKLERGDSKITNVATDVDENAIYTICEKQNADADYEVNVYRISQAESVSLSCVPVVF